MSTAQIIEEKLSGRFDLAHLDVVNESGNHNVPDGSETHFKVVIVAEAFDGQRKVARHQQVYALLADQLEGPVHALALHTYTPDEWQLRRGEAPQSPDCLGGSKADAG